MFDGEFKNLLMNKVYMNFDKQNFDKLIANLDELPAICEIHKIFHP